MLSWSSSFECSAGNLSSFRASFDWVEAHGPFLTAHINPPTDLSHCNLFPSSTHNHLHFPSTNHQPSTAKGKTLQTSQDHPIHRLTIIMSNNNTKKIDVPALSERDMELLIGALRCAEGGFPKVSRILPILILDPWHHRFPSSPIPPPCCFPILFRRPHCPAITRPKVHQHASLNRAAASSAMVTSCTNARSWLTVLRSRSI